MKVGVLKETKNNEFRVGLIPSSVQELIRNGHEVFVETGAGMGIGIKDEEYSKLGAKILANSSELITNSELIIKVKEPTKSECHLLNENKIIFTYLHLAALPEQLDLLKKSNCAAIAYETVTSPTGGLPLLAPMSEVAGRLSILSGAEYLLKSRHGKGVLLNGVPGVRPSHVVIIGAGVVGTNALISAAGAGARVTVLDVNTERLRQLDSIYGNRITTMYASEFNIKECIVNADIIVGAVLIPGKSAPKLITKDMIKDMEEGTVFIDVAIDQGGCAETSKATTYEDPTYIIDGVIHYCVANMPGGVAKTSSFALNNATLKYIVEIANKGLKSALEENQHLLNGLNVYKGQITHMGVAESFGVKYTNPKDLL